MLANVLLRYVWGWEKVEIEELLCSEGIEALQSQSLIFFDVNVHPLDGAYPLQCRDHAHHGAAYDPADEGIEGDRLIVEQDG